MPKKQRNILNSDSIFEMNDTTQKSEKPVTCLGLPFASEDERRDYFRKELRNKLPDLKKIEGFPIGEDEDILNLSDPPYYTACPNPWLNDFIDEWEKEKEGIPGRKKDFRVNEPYASDVSEGKNNPIYNAHSYHTKVPHPAIMRYILHYTQPGDIVFDGFAGTGMTGVAAQVCGKPDSELQFRIETEFRKAGLSTPVWGARKTICGDLSPIASFIAYNYNTPVNLEAFETEARRILKEVEKECGWMYETKHTNGTIGQINFTIWSDVFVCPNCGKEIIFWEAAVDKEKDKVRDEFVCPSCQALQTKRELDKAVITIHDEALDQTIRLAKTTPVLINYSVNGKRHKKIPDTDDLLLIENTDTILIQYWFPINSLPLGDKMSDPRNKGFTHVHHVYTHRNLYSIACCVNKMHSQHLFIITALFRTLSKFFRWAPHGKHTAGTSGNLYIPSVSHEYPPFEALERRLSIFKDLLIFKSKIEPNVLISTNSASVFMTKDQSVDYIFTDPPFGANLMYSELNYISESWIKVKTNNLQEAIENRTQGKSLFDYQKIMERCFSEYYRILKSGKWMTVEFSNTSAAVWNGIQTSLQRAGFVVANVAAIDKQQGSFNAVTTTTAVKQDLVISCYKPSSEFETKFKTLQGDMAIWDFVSEHLEHLPVHIKKENSTTAIIERSPKIIFDRLITFYLMRGLPVPMDAGDFQIGLKQKYIERDGMFFSAEQASEYDEKKVTTSDFIQQSLYVTNESDAIEWLKERLRKLPQKYQDIMPDFRIATQALRKGDSLPELQNILNENFIQENDGRYRTPNPNEAKDREALRNKVLLKEFAGYVTAINQPKAKKLKEVRVEALRGGFKSCWEKKEFQTIVTMGDKIPQNLLLEDEQLLMFYDIAKDRI